MTPELLLLVIATAVAVMGPLKLNVDLPAIIRHLAARVRRRRRPQDPPVITPQGALAPLIKNGVIRPADQLVHNQSRKGNTFEGTVTRNGGIRTAHGTFASPSPALAELTGTSINGWKHWVHVPTGKTLAQLRQR